MVISLERSGFKHNLIKFSFLDLTSLNSGKYLPACLINHIGILDTFCPLIQSLRIPIIKL